MASTPVTEDAFLGGRLRLRQPAKGHRAGTDAILLAAAAPAEISGFALDIGAGVGAAGLALARLRPNVTLGLVEQDPFTAALARDNLSLNGLESLGHVYEADVLSRASLDAAGLRSGSAHLVITNPPFLDPARARVSPEPGKRAAHTMPDTQSDSLSAWIVACLTLLRADGLMVMIHKPEALPDIVASLCGRAGALTILPIYPREGQPATRILLRARKGSRGLVSIAAGIALHSGEMLSATAEALHRGQALIEW